MWTVTVHELKTWPEPFKAAAGGRKTFEWRKDDRNYAEGDTLVLREWDHAKGIYTGREYTRRVGYVLRGPEFGVPEGWAVLSLVRPPKPPKRRRQTKTPRVQGRLSPRVPAPKPIPAKTARQWVRLTSGGLPTLGKRK